MKESKTKQIEASLQKGAQCTEEQKQALQDRGRQGAEVQNEKLRSMKERIGNGEREQEADAPELEKQVRHQMRVIKQGAVELIGEEELAEKVRNSILKKSPLTIKFGMDPSAPDLHLGHAVVLRKLRQLQMLGHTVVIIIGDFTAKIGDPTGKSKGRKAMTDSQVLRNAQTYQEQVFRILDREKTQVRYNGEWLELLQLDEVLKLASTMTVARMLERDDFQKRFRTGVPIGLHEFFYPLMQAYDSVVLEADLELGGTDQTFNVLMGRTLQKERGQSSQAALFMPILEGIDGVEKMSKSLGNYIGVDENARDMFTKVMQVPDGLILKYFELATDILPEELDKVREQLESGVNPRDVKLRLAREITALYCGAEEAAAAERFFQEAFTKREVPAETDGLPVGAACKTLFDCVKPLIALGYVASGGEFRRLILQGGVKRNGTVVKTLEEPVQEGDVLKIGKRKFVRVEYSR